MRIELEKLSHEEILIADRVLDAGEKTRNLISSTVAIGCGAFTAVSLASNPIGWSATLTAVGISMLRGGVVTHAFTTLWHHGEIRNKARSIRFVRTIKEMLESATK